MALFICHWGAHFLSTICYIFILPKTHKASGLSSSTMTKLRKGEDVSMEALRKICVALNCNISDIVEFVSDNAEA